MDWSSAILAGVIATAVMTIVTYVGKAMGMQMDMPRMLGLMFVGPESGVTTRIGLVVHFMMGVIFAIIYVALFGLLGLAPSWQWGALFGAVHGVLAGMAFGMMPALHPRMGADQPLPAPGMFGHNLGGMMPLAIIVLHVIFGVVVGGVYASLIA